MGNNGRGSQILRDQPERLQSLTWKGSMERRKIWIKGRVRKKIYEMWEQEGQNRLLEALAERWRIQIREKSWVIHDITGKLNAKIRKRLSLDLKG